MEEINILMHGQQKTSLRKLGFLPRGPLFSSVITGVKGAGQLHLTEETMEVLANKEQKADP